MEPTFFETPADLRAWFEANHETARELLIGFHKVGSGRRSITWPEAVDEALCVGWIDGIRRRIDDSSYSIRFTPRRKSGIWSAVNIARVAELTAAGRMQPAGLLGGERQETRNSHPPARDAGRRLRGGPYHQAADSSVAKAGG
jgi:uncharacterized protein YdeI (YjbR/CyaY-like superfamily)